MVSCTQRTAWVAKRNTQSGNAMHSWTIFFGLNPGHGPSALHVPTSIQQHGVRHVGQDRRISLDGGRSTWWCPVARQHG